MYTRRLLFAARGPSYYTPIAGTYQQTPIPSGAHELLRPPTLIMPNNGAHTYVSAWQPITYPYPGYPYNYTYYDPNSYQVPPLMDPNYTSYDPTHSNTSGEGPNEVGQKSYKKGLSIANLRNNAVAEADAERAKYGGAAGPLGPAPSSSTSPTTTDNISPEGRHTTVDRKATHNRWIRDGSSLSESVSRLGFTPRVRVQMARSYKDLLWDFGPFLFVLLFILPEILDDLYASWYTKLVQDAFDDESRGKK
eukprot:GILI01029240.1.p1 GENE.GILI01029240.1~~GILI01029240.1.p1  ORF type:complete len:250 (-),score=13.76 GILI01029240.1:33-782(-)